MKTRYLQHAIQNDALKSFKIAFISGPRQVGKTTLAKEILDEKSLLSNYFNFDDDEFRKIWIKNPKLLLSNSYSSNENNNSNKIVDTIVFDEIHKERTWKNKLKGLYDLYGAKTNFIVTGSARLDYFRKSGDSLQGRYFPYRLHPFTLVESSIYKSPPADDWQEYASNRSSITSIDDLLELGGFPEPLWGGSALKAKRWQRLYRERMIRDDLRDLQNIRELRTLENLILLLRDRAAGQLSYESLRQDLSCSADSVHRWIDLLEALYFCYTIRPYTNKIKNSLKKEPKIYLFDWAQAEGAGARWENMIAGHLLKNVHAWTDLGDGEFELHYVRDKQKREVDFLVTKDRKPYLLLEVKSNNSHPTNSLIYFQNLLKPTFCIQLVKEKKHEISSPLSHPNISIMSAERFLSSLN
ncbi:MAG: ATP-binding protein [Oligoflexia bacterium]|nr:ATP-binding protein [Oligoflexia bacterium]